VRSAAAQHADERDDVRQPLAQDTEVGREVVEGAGRDR